MTDEAVYARLLPVVHEAPVEAADTPEPQPGRADIPLNLDQAIKLACSKTHACARPGRKWRQPRRVPTSPSPPSCRRPAPAPHLGLQCPCPARRQLCAGLAQRRCHRLHPGRGRRQLDRLRFRAPGGRYGQAVTQTRIQKLALERARQTIAFEVARAYFQSLFTAVLRMREPALTQANAVLADTQAPRAGGVADREAVLRAEVEVRSHEEFVSGRQPVLDAASNLNLVLGRATVLPVQVQDVSPGGRTSDSRSSRHCSTPSRHHPEVEIGREAVAEAAYGEKAARADLLPKIYVRGTVVRADSGAHRGLGDRRRPPRRADAVRRRPALAIGHARSPPPPPPSLDDDDAGPAGELGFQAIGTHQERIRLGETAVAQARTCT